MSSIAEQHKAVITALWDAMNARRLDARDALVAADVVRHCPATPDVQIRSLEDCTTFMRGFDTALPDNVQTLPKLVADEDHVAAWSSYTGTQHGTFGSLAPSGRRAEFEFAAIFRMAAGKVAEWWVTWDNMGILGQLGALG